MTLKAHIGDDLMRAGIQVVFVQQHSDGSRNVYAPGGDTSQRITPDDPTASNIVPLSLRDDEARVLLAALHTYFGGADDTRLLRKDYEAERARVDKLIDAWIPRSA